MASELVHPMKVHENTILLKPDEFDAFVESLDEPAEFVPEMAALLRRRGKIPKR
jgi:uncharacterized protein (DUF1778 family)